MITFKGVGFVYKLDVPYLITALTSAVVLLGLATNLVMVYAKYLHSAGAMIRNVSMERLSVGTRLAKIALRNVTNASSFVQLDKTGDHKVKISDLRKTFEEAGANLTAEEGKAIATLIIARSNDNGATLPLLHRLKI